MAMVGSACIELPPHGRKRGIDFAQIGFDGAQAYLHFGGYIALEHSVDPEPAKDTRCRFARRCDLRFDDRQLTAREQRAFGRGFLNRGGRAPFRSSEEHTTVLPSL